MMSSKLHAYSPYLVGISLITILVMSMPTTNYSMGNLAYAELTRKDIKNLENTIDDLEKDEINKIKEIDKFKKTMSDNKLKVDEQKDVVREAKRDRNESWDSQVDVTKEENKLINLEKIVAEDQKKYIQLLTDRSDIIKFIREFEKQLVEDKKQIKVESKFDHSQYTKLIGIELSNTCITMIKNNFTTTCPSYEDLLGLDSSIQEYSGKFITTDGFFHRDKTQYKNSWKLYENDPIIRIIVDPPVGMSERIKTIILKPNFGTYILTDSKQQESMFEYIDKIISSGVNKTKTISVLNQTQQYGKILYHDRYVDNCKDATINADVWKSLLPQTIHHLRTDCEFTSFNNKEIIYPNRTNIDLSSSPNYKYQEWLSQTKESCLSKYQECTESYE